MDAKIRAMTANDARIVLMTARSGHFEASRRFVTLEEAALIQAFALDVAGLNRGGDAPDVARAPAAIIGPSSSGRPAVPQSAPRQPQ
jgi:hypothetical protein